MSLALCRHKKFKPPAVFTREMDWGQESINDAWYYIQTGDYAAAKLSIANSKAHWKMAATMASQENLPKSCLAKTTRGNDLSDAAERELRLQIKKSNRPPNPNVGLRILYFFNLD